MASFLEFSGQLPSDRAAENTYIAQMKFCKKEKLAAMSDIVAAIQACKYLYLHSITEPEDNTLRVILLEAGVGSLPDEQQLAAEPMPEVRELQNSWGAIDHTPGCQVFELTWPSYVGYSVENESFAVEEPTDSIGEGRLMVEYTRSVYLSYLSKATFASEDYPGPFKHWAFYCLNHTVNVASVDSPHIVASMATNPASHRMPDISA